MAFTRKALKELGITEDTLEKVMQLYGNAMGDYTPKTDVKEAIDTAVAAAVAEAKKGTEGIDIEELKTQAGKVAGLEEAIAKADLDYSIRLALAKKNYVSEKAVVALLNMESIKKEGDKLVNLDEQLTAIETENPWIIVASTQPAAGGVRQAAPASTKSEDQAYLDGKYKNNPFYTKKE